MIEMNKEKTKSMIIKFRGMKIWGILCITFGILNVLCYISHHSLPFAILGIILLCQGDLILTNIKRKSSKI